MFNFLSTYYEIQYTYIMVSKNTHKRQNVSDLMKNNKPVVMKCE